MREAAVTDRPMHPNFGARLVRTGLVIAVVDGLFASALNVFAYHATVMQLWQRVASTVLGPAALQGGMRTALVGVAMHVGVAFAWSALFLLLVDRWPRLRRTIATPAGVLMVALLYGPAIWLVMSLVVIPLATGRPPAAFGVRWWVQLAGHIPFVALPIVAMSARESAEPARADVAPATA